MFSQILTSCRSLSRKNYKNWQRLCKRTWFKDIKFAVKSRKIEKKNSIVISVSGYENKVKYPILNNNKYQKEKTTSIYFWQDLSWNTVHISKQ